MSAATSSPTPAWPPPGPAARRGGRKPKMTPELVDKAQRMYDSRQFTMAEIATSCGGVTPMTIYRNIRIRTVDGTAADVA